MSRPYLKIESAGSESHLVIPRMPTAVHNESMRIAMPSEGGLCEIAEGG